MSSCIDAEVVIVSCSRDQLTKLVEPLIPRCSDLWDCDIGRRLVKVHGMYGVLWRRQRYEKNPSYSTQHISYGITVLM